MSCNCCDGNCLPAALPSGYVVGEGGAAEALYLREVLGAYGPPGYAADIPFTLTVTVDLSIGASFNDFYDSATSETGYASCPAFSVAQIVLTVTGSAAFDDQANGCALEFAYTAGEALGTAYQTYSGVGVVGTVTSTGTYTASVFTNAETAPGETASAVLVVGHGGGLRPAANLWAAVGGVFSGLPAGDGALGGSVADTGATDPDTITLDAGSFGSIVNGAALTIAATSTTQVSGSSTSIEGHDGRTLTPSIALTF